MQKQATSFEYFPLAQEDGSIVNKVGAALLPTYRTNLRANNVGGLLCPGGTIVNHERNSITRNLVLFAEISLHFLVLLMQIVKMQELINYENSIIQHQGEFSPEDVEQIKESILNEAYLSDEGRCLVECTVNAWLCWNVGIRLFYFAFYRPRYESEAYKPSLLTKIFFPLATVYYHEENEICNPHVGLTYLCGFIYPLCCYEPSYETEREIV